MINILGSCVTRDAFTLSAANEPLVYVARQTIAGLHPHMHNHERAWPRPVINGSPSAWERRVLNHDICKSVFSSFDRDFPLIIDLIDERYRLVQIGPNYYTYSSVAERYTNMRAIGGRFISALGCERRELTYRSMPGFIKELKKFENIILHLAYFDDKYIGEELDIGSINLWLAELYDQLILALPTAKTIQVAESLRIVSDKHVWGKASMHFIDDYYVSFLKELDACLYNGGYLSNLRPKATLQRKHS